jgi:L-alanine-DL-glutamate epimerase-like enolase superfamily enzyme
MKITGADLILYEPAWNDDPFTPRGRVFVALKLRTDEGLVGISRSWGPQVPYLRDELIPIILGEDPRNVERLWAKLDAATITRLGHEPAMIAAIGALDIALWDLLGKSAGLPCWQLLGGYRDWVDVYADVPTRANTPAELGDQLARCVEAGYRAVKFHVLRNDPEHIVAETRAARQAIGPDVKLLVDFFRAFDPRTAGELARRLEEFDVFWLEEPVRWNDQPLGLALVARETCIPIAGGEGENSLYGCRDILERGGVSYFQANVLGVGGYTSWRKIAGLVLAHHARIAPHGAGFPEINAHLVAAYPPGRARPRHHPRPATGGLVPPLPGLPDRRGPDSAHEQTRARDGVC